MSSNQVAINEAGWKRDLPINKAETDPNKKDRELSPTKAVSRIPPTTETQNKYTYGLGP